jgi:hypothetical protein
VQSCRVRSVRSSGTGITLVRLSEFSKTWAPLSNETCNFPRLPGMSFTPYTRIRLATCDRWSSFATHTNANGRKGCGGDLMISALLVLSSTIDRLSDACLQAASILMQAQPSCAASLELMKREAASPRQSQYRANIAAPDQNRRTDQCLLRCGDLSGMIWSCGGWWWWLEIQRQPVGKRDLGGINRRGASK